MGPAVVEEEMRSEYASQSGDLKRRDNDGDLCVDGKVILKPVLQCDGGN
jgi:hypothetical protein